MYRSFFVFLITAAVFSALLFSIFFSSEPSSLWRARVPSGQFPSLQHEVDNSKYTHADAEGNAVVDLSAAPTALKDSDEPETTLTGLPQHGLDTHLSAANEEALEQAALEEAAAQDAAEAEAVSSDTPYAEVAQDVVPAPPQDIALVIATVRKSNNTWIDEELSDLLTPSGPYTPYLYVNNDQQAPLHTPANKGHEAMVYLTYIIENYDRLPEISVFIHGHSLAWHNNLMLSMSTAELLRRLRMDKIQKDGYFNLRCHFNPGCPEHLYPFATEYEEEKMEELMVKDVWQQVFQVTEDEVPRVLAQACCSQFAVTAERIRSQPLERYVHFRDWLIGVDMIDYMSGRMFEYFWQYIFVGKSVFCPDPRVCYCAGYGVCYVKPEQYDEWMELEKSYWRLYNRARAWKIWGQGEDGVQRRSSDVRIFERDDEEFVLGSARVETQGNEAKADAWTKLGAGMSYMTRRRSERRDEEDDPDNDMGPWLEQEMDRVVRELDERRNEALDCGADPACRQTALKAVEGLDNPPSEDPGHWQ